MSAGGSASAAERGCRFILSIASARLFASTTNFTSQDKDTDELRSATKLF